MMIFAAVLLFLWVANVVAGSNVNLTSTTRNELPEEFCPDYYYFRCEVRNSVLLIWKIGGIDTHHLGHSSKANEFYKNGNFNFFTEIVTTGASASQTSYVSHLFFHSSILNDTMDVMCASSEDNDAISVDNGPVCEESIIAGNTEMSSSPGGSSYGAVPYTPGQYYSFRCAVTGSVFLAWRVSGVLIQRFGPNSDHFFLQIQDFNILMLEVIPGEPLSNTNYVSYLWFKSGSNMRVTNVTCESSTSISTIKLRVLYPTLLPSPTQLPSPSLPSTPATSKKETPIADGGLAGGGDTGWLVVVAFLVGGLIISV